MITIAELATTAGTTPEKFARFAGALTDHDPRTGRLPQRWAGQGLDATFTPDEADGLLAEWDRAATYAEAVAYGNPDPEAAEVAERYRP